MPSPRDEHWSTYYDRGIDFWQLREVDVDNLLRHVEPDLPKTNLDIGCGTGMLTRQLHQRGYTCLGIDASTSAITRAAAAAKDTGLEYLHFDIEADDTIALPGQAYSLITCKLVYAFMRDKPAMLRKVADLLADRGTFIIVTPLTEDVLPEKADIAVDYDTTAAELKSVFESVTAVKGNGVTYFFCSN